MSTLSYIRFPDGTFKQKGAASTRFVYLRILRNGVWKEPIMPMPRAAITTLMEGDPAYLPGDIYELVEIESTMSDETREKLAKLTARKRAEKDV